MYWLAAAVIMPVSAILVQTAQAPVATVLRVRADQRVNIHTALLPALGDLLSGKHQTRLLWYE